MSKPISDYALIGDMRTTALVTRDGAIDWLCWPRHDSPAVFTRLLDDARGGAFTLALDDGVPDGRAYRDGTNILETRFRTPDGAATLTDAMPVHAPATRRDAGPDGDAPGRIVRRLHCTAGAVRGLFRLHATPDYGRAAAAPRPEADGSLLIESPDLAMRLTGSAPLAFDGTMAWMCFVLEAGETAWVVLAREGGDTGLPPIREAGDVAAALERTQAYWEGWSGALRYDGAYREAVVRSALALKLLTYAPTGGIVAAATTSLPEAVPGARNYDYRFSWVRDASFTVTAFCTVGATREAAEYLRYLRKVDGSGGRDLKLIYGIDGAVPAEETLAHLPGWNGVGPVRIGNAAKDQQQFDIYGEVLIALHAYLSTVDFKAPDGIADGLASAIETLADEAAACRDKADHGIWELRGGQEQILHTKALIWVALDRAAKLADRIEGIDAGKVQHWREVATALRAEYERRAWSETRQAYMRSYESDVLDAAVLRIVLFGALDPADPRTLSTLDAVERELSDGDLTYRYREDDGLEGVEGTFTACAFWRVGCLALAGRTAPAKALFERLLARSNDVGLFAEEIDAASGDQRGNFPQGFTQMCVINHAVRLDECIARFGLPDAVGPEV